MCRYEEQGNDARRKENEMTYGIKHKETGLMFAGFDANGDQIWADASSAWKRDRITAQAQASLLAVVGVNVQRKVVAL